MSGRQAPLRVAALPRLALLVVVGTILHVALLHRIAPFGVVPGTLMVLTAVAAVETGPDFGATTGFLCGLALNVIDIDSTIGLPSLLFCIMGWLVGGARDRVFPGAERVPFALVALSSAVTTGFYGLLITASSGLSVGALRHLGLVVAVTLVLNPLVSILLGPVVRTTLRVNWNER
jgi:rod shape-determining protein MreD